MKSVQQLQIECHDIAEQQGFHSLDPKSKQGFMMLMALVHTEVSEAVQYVKKNVVAAPTDSDLDSIGEEFADTVIRLLDIAQMLGINMQSSIETKMEFNKARGYRYNWKSFPEETRPPES